MQTKNVHQDRRTRSFRVRVVELPDRRFHVVVLQQLGDAWKRVRGPFERPTLAAASRLAEELEASLQELPVIRSHPVTKLPYRISIARPTA